ncbi:unnamed protein product [Clavelina lepadiformis]|uniref:Uncharacterized protein n=1 Tax=Clavelina lepadiformis TaxID=159417 RepID=A0ABP0F4Z1_CLALP
MTEMDEDVSIDSEEEQATTFRPSSSLRKQNASTSTPTVSSSPQRGANQTSSFHPAPSSAMTLSRSMSPPSDPPESASHSDQSQLTSSTTDKTLEKQHKYCINMHDASQEGASFSSGPGPCCALHGPGGTQYSSEAFLPECSQQKPTSSCGRNSPKSIPSCSLNETFFGTDDVEMASSPEEDRQEEMLLSGSGCCSLMDEGSKRASSSQETVNAASRTSRPPERVSARAKYCLHPDKECSVRRKKKKRKRRCSDYREGECDWMSDCDPENTVLLRAKLQKMEDTMGVIRKKFKLHEDNIDHMQVNVKKRTYLSLSL